MEGHIQRQTESIVFSSSLSPAIVAQVIVSDYRTSPKIEHIKTALQYFDGHSLIDGKKRVYFDKQGKSHENPAASNARVKSNFLRILVQQKQDYGFAKSFSLKLSTETQKEIDLSKDEYGIAWKAFCDRELYKMAHLLAGQSVNNGIAWIYVWIDEQGNLRIKDIPSELVYPVWHDRQHSEIDRLVYNYVQLRYNSASADKVEYAEYWTANERHLFNVSNGYSEENVLLDDNGSPVFSHMTDNEAWGRIPFVALKATDDEKPMLDFIKAQIDAYDTVFSRGVDGVIDDLDPILMVKDMSGELEVLKETKELMRLTRLVAVSPDGDAHFISADTNIEKHISTMEKLRKDIFKFGYGVDTSDARFGGNPNQLEIKSLYQDLDTYTDGLERHFQNFVEQLKYFFDKWWEFSGHGSFEIAQSYKVLVLLDRSMLINESAQIDDTVKLSGTGVSQKTLLEFNPAVQDVEIELQRIEDEKSKNEAENPLFNFPKIETTTGADENPDTEEKEVEE